MWMWTFCAPHCTIWKVCSEDIIANIMKIFYSYSKQNKYTNLTPSAANIYGHVSAKAKLLKKIVQYI